MLCLSKIRVGGITQRIEFVMLYSCCSRLPHTLRLRLLAIGVAGYDSETRGIVEQTIWSAFQRARPDLIDQNIKRMDPLDLSQQDVNIVPQVLHQTSI